MSKTNIEGTEKSWNPVTGCDKVSEGCKNCSAEGIAKRFWKDRKFTDVQCHEDRLEQPLHWRKPSMVFVNSMSDLFHPAVPFEFIYTVYKTMKFSSQHIFQILTKRPDRALKFYNEYGQKNMTPLPNVWFGVSVENQESADERIPILLQIPAAVRWVSYEPALGGVNLRNIDAEKAGHESIYFIDSLTGKHDDMARPCEDVNKLDWVVAGGESGPKARPAHPDWFRKVRDDCKAAGVPFFMKQICRNGRKIPFNEFPIDLQIRESPVLNFR